MRLFLRAKPLVFGLAASVLVTAAVWFYASEVNRRGVCSIASLEKLLVVPASALQRVDIGRMNLLCAQGLPGADGFVLDAGLVKLDEVAARVRNETERHLYRFQKNPAEFEHSEGFFRMLVMAVVLYEDFSVRYNPERMSAPGATDPNDHFFADSRDIFLHGLLGTRNNSPSPNPLPEERVTALRPALNPNPSTLRSTATEDGSTLNRRNGSPCASLPGLPGDAYQPPGQWDVASPTKH